MIISFGDKTTSDFFHGIKSRNSRRIPNQIQEVALYKLDVINAAQALDDLKSPPGNRLEALSGDLKEFYSIRINSQWRIIFKWIQNNASEVQIVDYH
jgi:toxin HigB-1